MGRVLKLRPTSPVSDFAGTCRDRDAGDNWESDESSSESSPKVSLRRSEQIKRAPGHLKDFVVHTGQCMTPLLNTSTSSDSSGWEIKQMYVNNVILLGDVDKEVHMQLPPGFSSSKSIDVCRFRKSLYGLQQGSSNWFSKFAYALR
ncbi:hypothetical protein CRG98_029225 [Punica granatum]|uniref:Reverse transcriptase Ty1/copia-type domain-containing protein n=1 Tax=Punica granatum TaxID=22663 RepID=A0A2I0J2D5_PUNGR|nr:hypothetical protein CRG98_029225 [Punica granatum]